MSLMGHRNPEASVNVDASIDLVWSIMCDVDAYPEWNPFVVRAECHNPPRVGDPILLHVRWADGSGVRSPERIVTLEPPTRDEEGTMRATMAYVFEGWPARLGLIRGTRRQELVQAPGEPTTYSTFEEFRGPLVKFAGPGRVADGFRRHATALKERAESAGS